jgi:hypothetical protein
MQKSTKTALLDSDENNIKLTADLVAGLGLTSAIILELTKNSPRGRKIAFVGMGGLTIVGILAIIYSMKKMT